MLLQKFSGSEGQKKVRITEEFAQLLVVVRGDDSAPRQEVFSAFLERAGKNVEIANRLKISDLATLSQNIESIPKKLYDDDFMFTLSLFENGNFKSRENDAVVLEFSNLKDEAEYEIFGLQDFEDCSAIYKYEAKTILSSERTKAFSLVGVERIFLPQSIQFDEMGILYRDANGGLIERKMTRTELDFSVITQVAMNPFTEIEEPRSGLALVVDGLEQVKFYSSVGFSTAHELIFQSKYFLDSSVSQVANAGAVVSNLNVGTVVPVYGNPNLNSLKRML